MCCRRYSSVSDDSVLIPGSPIPFGIGSQESLGMKLPAGHSVSVALLLNILLHFPTAVVALLFSVPVLYDRYQVSP